MKAIHSSETTGSSICSHLLTLFPRSRIFLPWRWRRYFPPKRRFTQDLHGATSEKTVFFIRLPSFLLLSKLNMISYRIFDILSRFFFTFSYFEIRFRCTLSDCRLPYWKFKSPPGNWQSDPMTNNKRYNKARAWFLPGPVWFVCAWTPDFHRNSTMGASYQNSSPLCV
jgi:hypothetical protein